MRDNWRLPSLDLYHVRCGICDREDYLSVSQARQGCPTCARPTFILKRYKFYWCLKCGSRYKRLGRRDWEDASSLLEDGNYWLFSLGSLLRIEIGRTTKNRRAPK